jgi:S1-C subfamily serine protease
MNTMIFSSSGSSAGIGFAVPVQSIKRIVPQLIKYGKVIRPGLGVGVLPEQQMARFGIDKGVVVTNVAEKSPAAKAGIQGITQDRRGRYYLGDVIVGIDNHEIKNYDDIYHVLDKYEVGDKVKVHFIRDDKKKSVSLSLTEL